MKTLSWDEMYLQAKLYYQEYGNLLAPAKYVTADGIKLGYWISRQRKEYKTNYLSSERISLLEDIGMIWSIYDVKPKVEKIVDGYSGFLLLDDNGLPLVAMHWEHRFNHMVHRYNEIYRVRIPNITPHVCRHTYCSNQAKAGMNPKTLQYLMGHSDIGVTMNVYTHLGLEDAEKELRQMEEFKKAQEAVEKKEEKPVSQKVFKVV